MDKLIVPHSEPSIVPTHWHPLPGLPIDELKPDDYCSRAQRRENINGN